MQKALRSFLVSTLIVSFTLPMAKAEHYWGPLFEFQEPKEEIEIKIPHERTTEEIIFSEEKLKSIKLSEVNYLDQKGLGDLLEKHSGERKAELFIPLDSVDISMVGFLAASSLGLVIFKNDKELMNAVQDNKDILPTSVYNFGNAMGHYEGITGVIAGSYLLGVVLDNDKMKRVGLISIAGLAATGIVTESFKQAFGRTRPSHTDSPYDFFVPGNKSFFSGHTSSAFSLATVISEAYGKDYPIVPYIAYGVASLTAISRMSVKAHWASDVFVGAIAGHLITKIVYHMIDNSINGKKVPENERWLSITPSIDFENKGFMINVEYTPKAWRPRTR